MKNIRTIAQVLSHYHMKCYYVGGCVRDEIMGIPASDIDICIVGAESFKQVHRILEDLVDDTITSLTPVHGSFPIWIVECGDEKYEFAMARTERKSGNSRTEFDCEVVNVSIEDDLSRRDFTINAIAKEVLFGDFIDPFGGIQDINNGVIRHVSDAFDEDVLRVYRAARFCAKFGFSVAIETMLKCTSMRDRANEISMERIGMELHKVMECDKPARFFIFLAKVTWLNHAFAELQNLMDVEQDPIHHPEGDAFFHTLHCINAAKDPFTRVVMLCHDLGKATTTSLNKHGRWCAHGHEEAGVPLTNDMLKRIKYANWQTINQIKCLVKRHMIRVHISKKRVRECLRELMHCRVGYEQLVKVVQADMDGRPPRPYEKAEIMQEYADELIATDAMTPIVTGKLLLSIGMEPGELMGECIKKALIWQDGGSLNKTNWLKMLRNIKQFKKWYDDK